MKREEDFDSRSNSMMRGLIVFALAGVMFLLLGASAMAEQPAADPLRAMVVSAKGAQQDAAIYQWARVNRHVDRIIGDLHKVERALAHDPARQSLVQELQRAVRSLSEARLKRDRLKVVEAAQRVERLASK
jgi:hypothetical protein